MTRRAGGTVADIKQINWPWLPLFSMSGDDVADLSELLGTIDFSNWTLDQLAAATMNGKLNGLPLSTTGRVVMFDKTSYDKAGLHLPTTRARPIETAAFGLAEDADNNAEALAGAAGAAHWITHPRQACRPEYLAFNGTAHRGSSAPRGPAPP